MNSVAGRVVLITGAARGMGRLYAQRAVAEGAASVILWDVDAAALAATAAELEAAGGRIVPHVVDLASLESISQTARLVLEGPGAPHVLINNAGVVRSMDFWEHDAERDIEFTMRINALAPMHVTRAFLPSMIERDEPGRILNVSSAAGIFSNPRMSVYSSSKWAVIGWGDSLRLELLRAGHRHVTVTTLAPSYISTGMFAGARGPLLTPIMRPDYVVGRAWSAMLASRPLLMLPWTVGFGRFLKGVLPQRAFDFIADRVFGVYGSMDDFVGRAPERE